MMIIKYRAWDKETKTMYYQNNLNCFVINGNNGMGWVLWKTSDICKNNLQPIAGCGTGHLMQFTGVCDIHGTQIYYSDIVFAKHWNPKYQEVTFDRGGFCLKYPGSQYYHDIKYAEQMEVVGNIYQNTELLKLNNKKE